MEADGPSQACVTGSMGWLVVKYEQTIRYKAFFCLLLLMLTIFEHPLSPFSTTIILFFQQSSSLFGILILH